MRTSFITSGRLLLAALFLATGCEAYNYTAPDRSIASVSLALGANPLEVGQSTVATSTARDQAGTPIAAGAAVYVSSAPEVAGVNPVTGQILAIAPGITQITVTIDGISDRRSVTVSTAPMVRINEVWPNGDLPGGFIELFNPTGADIDVSGWSVSGGDVSRSFVLPPGAKVLSRDFLIIAEGTLGVPLKPVDAAHLFSRFGVQVDQVDWAANPLTSLGRCPDGTGPFVPTAAVTRRAPNDCAIGAPVP
jgi:Lamin Tail Domain